MQTTERAYAKINYQLYVGEKRPDGFHEISTLMQTISLSDEVYVSVTDGEGISLTVDGNPDVPTDSRNLVWRAANVYLECLGVKSHVDIRLVKHIPMAGGLAGGSADAGATLRALNRLFNSALDEAQMRALAATLGSDVVFCYVGGLAHCTGRGEKVASYPTIEGVRHFLIYNGGEPVSTPAAYTALDMCGRERHPAASPDELVRILSENVDRLAQVMFNDFESVILPTCPIATDALHAFRGSGACAAMMSGSGSTVFAVYRSEADALEAQKNLPFEAIYATDVFPSVLKE